MAGAFALLAAGGAFAAMAGLFGVAPGLFGFVLPADFLDEVLEDFFAALVFLAAFLAFFTAGLAFLASFLTAVAFLARARGDLRAFFAIFLAVAFLVVFLGEATTISFTAQTRLFG